MLNNWFANTNWRWRIGTAAVHPRESIFLIYESNLVHIDLINYFFLLQLPLKLTVFFGSWKFLPFYLISLNKAYLGRLRHPPPRLEVLRYITHLFHIQQASDPIRTADIFSISWAIKHCVKLDYPFDFRAGVHARIQIYWCTSSIFRHLKLELLTQFPASNDEKYINVVYIWRKFVSFYGYVHWRMTTEISVMYGSEKVKIFCEMQWHHRKLHWIANRWKQCYIRPLHPYFIVLALEFKVIEFHRIGLIH